MYICLIDSVIGMFLYTGSDCARLCELIIGLMIFFSLILKEISSSNSSPVHKKKKKKIITK